MVDCKTCIKCALNGGDCIYVYKPYADAKAPCKAYKLLPKEEERNG